MDSRNDSLKDDDDSSFLKNIGLNSFANSSSLDVLGLDNETNGRLCEQHDCCGHHVRTSDVLYCSWQLQAVDRSGAYIPFSLAKPVEPIRPEKNQKRAAKATGTVQPKKRNINKPLTDDLFQDLDDEDNDGLEEVIKVYKVSKDGTAGCHVGYLPRRYFKKHGAKKFDHVFLRVVTNLCQSVNSLDIARSHRDHGVVVCQQIKNNPRYNGKKPLDGDPCNSSSSNTEDKDALIKPKSCRQINNKEEKVRFARHNNSKLFNQDNESEWLVSVLLASDFGDVKTL
jgi:hypothetical protein